MNEYDYSGHHMLDAVFTITDIMDELECLSNIMGKDGETMEHPKRHELEHNITWILSDYEDETQEWIIRNVNYHRNVPNEDDIEIKDDGEQE